MRKLKVPWVFVEECERLDLDPTYKRYIGTQIMGDIISKYSEETWCATWMSGIEDEVLLCLRDNLLCRLGRYEEMLKYMYNSLGHCAKYYDGELYIPYLGKPEDE